MFLAILLLSASAAIASVEKHDTLRLEPDMDQRYASSIATRFLTNYHYKRTRLDDSLSSEIFDNYLELLDPNRVYFLAGDIEMLLYQRPTVGEVDLDGDHDVLSVFHGEFTFG